MHDGETLCFIEVKYRKNSAFGGTAYSVSPSKQQKIIRSALHYISSHSQYQQSEDSFAPTTFFDFTNKSDNYKLEGQTSEPSVAPIFDKIFEENVVKFKEKAVFEQLISVTNTDLKQVDVYVEYQTCDDSKCIPGDYTFNISLDGSEIEKEKVRKSLQK